MLKRTKKSVKAQEIILVGKDGRESAALRQDEQGNTSLSFSGPDGVPRLSLGAAKNGLPRICLFYAQGKGSIEIEANDELNSAGMIMTGAKGKVQVLLGITRDGTPVFALLDEKGKPLLSNLLAPESETPETASCDWDSLLRN